MKLKDFVSNHDNGLLAVKLKKVVSDDRLISMESFHFIYGYIEAAYHFGVISLKESHALEDELLRLLL